MTARLVDSGRTLTVRQPWVQTLLSGRSIEVRSGPPAATVVGRRFWLHCSRTIDADTAFDEALLAGAGLQLGDAIPGCILGRARLAGWAEIERAGGDRWRIHRGLLEGAALDVGTQWLAELLPSRLRSRSLFVWVLDAVEACKPIGPATGQLGFWRLDDTLHQAALDAIAAARWARIAAAVDQLAWELGEPRREGDILRGDALVLGRDGPGGIRVRVAPARLLLEVTAGARWWRRDDFATAEQLVEELLRILRGLGVRNDAAGRIAPEGP